MGLECSSVHLYMSLDDDKPQEFVVIYNTHGWSSSSSGIP